MANRLYDVKLILMQRTQFIYIYNRKGHLLSMPKKNKQTSNVSISEAIFSLTLFGSPNLEQKTEASKDSVKTSNRNIKSLEENSQHLLLTKKLIIINSENLQRENHISTLNTTYLFERQENGVRVFVSLYLRRTWMTTTRR